MSIRVLLHVQPRKAPTSAPAKRSKVEIIKENSNFLRYPLMDDLANDEPNVSEPSVQLIKFHGSYQQVCAVYKAYFFEKFLSSSDLNLTGIECLKPV